MIFHHDDRNKRLIGEEFEFHWDEMAEEILNLREKLEEAEEEIKTKQNELEDAQSELLQERQK